MHITLQPVWAFFQQAFKESAQVSFRLFRIMIPILIGVKILQESGLIVYLAKPLNPVMQVMGLPGETGLIWATAMVNNLYSGIIVFLSLADSLHLSVAQVTVLSTVMLVAHALPIEVKIAHAAGTRFLFQALVRIGGAFVLGWGLHLAYSATGTLQQANTIFWQGDVPVQPSVPAWAAGQVRNLVLIFCIILALVILMRIMHKVRIVDGLIWVLRPVLRFLGIGREAATLTIIGMVMGLTYGGGLIIQESKSGTVGNQDVFSAVTLMGLTHSLIEDTLLLSLLGAHMSGILWARLGFSLVAVALLVRLLPHLSTGFVHRFLFAGQVQKAAAGTGGDRGRALR
ncbi:MAG: nucleoside recognition domain-containing protein [Desulfovermiculus sp.]